MRSALILLAGVASLTLSITPALADDAPSSEQRMGGDREDRSTLGEGRERGSNRDGGHRDGHRDGGLRADAQARDGGMRAMEVRQQRIAEDRRPSDAAPAVRAPRAYGWGGLEPASGERRERQWNRDGDRDRDGRRDRDGVRAPRPADGDFTARSGDRRVERDRARPPVDPRQDGLTARTGERWSAHRGGDRYRDWTRDWRRDNRYDWRRYRDGNRSRFRVGIYYDPYGWNYRRWDVGYSLFPRYYSSSFWLNDPWQYRLPPAYGPYRWVRYYDDALLVNIYTGQVVDVIYRFFW